MKNCIYSTTILALIASTASAQITLFEDSFDSGAGNFTSWGAVSSLSIIDDSDPGDIGSGNALAVAVSGSINAITAGFADTTLANEGDSITFSIDYRWQSSGSATSRAPALGIYNNNNTAGTSDDDFGYMLETNPADMRIAHESGTNNAILAGADFTYMGSPEAFNGYAATTPVNYTITLSRLADDVLQFGIVYTDYANSANNLSYTREDSSGTYFTFNEIALRSANKSYVIDNVLVTTTVPEPGTYALIGGCLALGAVMLRRRQG